MNGFLLIHNSTKLNKPIAKNKFHLFQDLIKSISRTKGRQSELYILKTKTYNKTCTTLV